MIQKFRVSRDDSIYEAWPDVTLTHTGKLICVFSECTHHKDRSYTRIVCCESTDRGRTWSEKSPVTAATQGLPYWNCARIQTLADGRILVMVDKVHLKGEAGAVNYMIFSDDDGITWSEPMLTPATGIVPDRLLELENGRWIISTHQRNSETGNLAQHLWYSDDRGTSWSGPVTVADQSGLNFCEVSILPVGTNLVAFLRENSGLGRPCYKTISHDYGETWSEPIPFPLPGCHRPVAGYLRDGSIFITYRFTQGGGRRHTVVDGQKTWGPPWQNFFGAVTDTDSALASSYKDAWTRIIPIDFDRSLYTNDLGYSGWVQFDDGEIYIVNYVMDDSPKCQIRGYSLRLEDFMIQPS